MEHIGPLLQCRHLETLVVEAGATQTILLSDSDMHTLATSLPVLRSLKINVSEPYEYGEEETTLSLLSIVHLLAVCPEISSIELLLNAKLPIPRSDVVDVAHIAIRDSLKLIIGFCPVHRDQHREIATFLKNLGVRETVHIEAWSEDLPRPTREMEFDYVRVWEEVQRLLEGGE